MRVPGLDVRKAYQQPLLRKLNAEQAILFLVGHADIGDRGARDLMELLFPSPADFELRTVQGDGVSNVIKES